MNKENMFFGEPSVITVKSTATDEQIEFLKELYPNTEIVKEEENENNDR